MLRVILASLHLLALAVGFGAVMLRAILLSALVSVESLRPAFRADSAWGGAAGLWIATGLWRYLGGIEKSTSYYTHNVIFMAKMAMLVLILLLEIWPMITLIRWRVAIGRKDFDTGAAASTAQRIATISFVQAALVVAMVFAATAMARGYGAR